MTSNLPASDSRLAGIMGLYHQAPSQRFKNMSKYVGFHHSAYAGLVFPWRMKPLIKTQGGSSVLYNNHSSPEGRSRAGFRNTIDARCFLAVGINLYLAFTPSLLQGCQKTNVKDSPAGRNAQSNPRGAGCPRDRKLALGRQRQTDDNKDDRVIMRNGYYLLRHLLRASPGVKCFCVLIGFHSPTIHSLPSRCRSGLFKT